MILNLTRDVHVFHKRLHLAAIIALCLPMASFAGSAETNGLSSNGKKEVSFTHYPLNKKVPFQTITGKVTDNKNNPLQGVTVLVKGTKTGTSTGADGRFSLPGAPDKGTLVFSSTGFATQEISLSGRTGAINITLAEETSALNEVIVVGYGTVKKQDLTGAVSQIKVTQLENQSPTNVTDVLRGNVPGLSISQVNGATAKGGGDLQVRGQTTISAGSSPLIVLDGVIYPGALSDVNPNDISTIDVLKDASSAAVFGAKAATGVIIINTKKGTKPKPTISLNTNIGYAENAINEKLYDGPGFVNWRSDVLSSEITNHKPYQFNDPSKLPPDITIDQWKAYDGAPAAADPLDIWLARLKMTAIEIANYKKNKQTNWYDMMFQKGIRQDHTLSVSGKTDNTSYYFSGGYVNNQGNVKGDNYKIFRIRTNLETKIAKYAVIGFNLQFADRDESAVPYNWPQMVNASPYGEVYNTDGTLRNSPNDDVGNNINPFLDNFYTSRLQKSNTLFGSVYAKGDLGWGFSYQVNFTPNFEFYRYFNGISAKDFQYSARGGIASRTNSTTYNWQIDNLIKWNRSFGQHTFDVTLLANAEKYQYWKDSIYNQGFTPSDVLSYHNIGAGVLPIVSSDDQTSTGDALMARLNYSFKSRYIFTASIRRDGYSAFGAGNPRANFPAAAVGWVFSQEKAVKSVKWLNYGKFRASYGLNGNRDIGRYIALSNLVSGKYEYVTPGGTVIPVAQLYVNNLSNPSLKWEKTAALNFGLDFAVLNNRISGSVDVYQKETKDLLITRAVPDVTGFANVISNLGQVNNKGIEIAINSTNIAGKNFSWRTTALFAMNRNKIVHLYGPVAVTDPTTGKTTMIEKDDVGNKRFIGHDINSIWDQKVLGVWQTPEAADAAKYGVLPGDFKVQDVNNDLKYSDADRMFLGSRSPKFTWTLRNDFTFLKQFDFSFMMYSSWGAMTDFNQAKNNGGFQDRQNSYIQPYWTATNPINNYARLFSSNGSASYSVYRRADFIRLNNVSLGYTLPKAMVQRAHLESLKIYINVTNAAIYQPDWNFWDVEYRNRDGAGNISTAIPPRIYSLGLNVTF